MLKATLTDGIEVLSTTFQVYQPDQWVPDMIHSLWEYREVRELPETDAKRVLKRARALEKVPTVAKLLSLFKGADSRPEQLRKPTGRLGCAHCVSGFIQTRSQLQALDRDPAPVHTAMVACFGCNGGVRLEELERRWREDAASRGLELILLEFGSPWLAGEEPK